jgi:hypothetical protein
MVMKFRHTHERAFAGLLFASLAALLGCGAEHDTTNVEALGSTPLGGASERPTPVVESASPSVEVMNPTPNAPASNQTPTAPAASGTGSQPSSEGAGIETGTGQVPAAGAPLFAVPTEVYGADFASSASYVPLVPSLDVSRVELGNAREVVGRASVAAIGPWLFVASSAAPVVERFEVQADGSLREAGRLSFMNYGVPDFFAIDAWGAVFINPEKAYLFNGSDGSHVVWNPTTLEITGEIAAPPGILRMGYNFESVSIVRGNRLYRIFTLLNYDTWEFLAAPQYLAVYDLDTDTLLGTVEESRCPQLYNRPFLDERGDIYFSGWVWTPGLTLTSDYPASCSLRVVAGQDTFDPSWQLNFAADVTGGREAGVLRYLGDGKALLDVFHAERTTIDASTDPEDLVNTPNWRLWSIDLATKTGAPVEGLDFKAGGYTDVVVGERTFLMVPNDDYSETTAFEVKGAEAVPVFSIQGSSYQLLQLR